MTCTNWGLSVLAIGIFLVAVWPGWFSETATTATFFGAGSFAAVFLLFFFGFTLTGLVQGSVWLHEGLPVWAVLPALKPYMALRAVGGSLLFLSFVFFSVNILATVARRLPMSHPPGRGVGAAVEGGHT